MLQVQATYLLSIPSPLQALFVKSVVRSYFNFDYATALFVSELNICDDIMVDLLSRSASLEIFEDEYFFTHLEEDTDLWFDFEEAINEKEEDFVYDIAQTLNRHSLCFRSDITGAFYNLPTKEVW